MDVVIVNNTVLPRELLDKLNKVQVVKKENRLVMVAMVTVNLLILYRDFLVTEVCQGLMVLLVDQ